MKQSGTLPVIWTLLLRLPLVLCFVIVMLVFIFSTTITEFIVTATGTKYGYLIWQALRIVGYLGIIGITLWLRARSAEARIADETERRIGADEWARMVNEMAEDAVRRERAETDERVRVAIQNREAHAGYIYLVQRADGQCKIGRAVNVHKRLSSFRTVIGPDLTLLHTYWVLDSLKEERRLHDLYKHRRAHGEWFKLNQQEIEKFKRLY